jgi:prepilin-type N-terminal cleavage/methylation domain-containing protein
MRTQKGTTMLELVAVLAIVAVLGAVAVPGASRVRAAVSAGEAARRLALVLRSAQAQAQSSASPVRVEVTPGGDYVVSRASGATVMSGSLGAGVRSTYPGGVLEFGERGWAGLPGATSPRAGHFDIDGTSDTVTVQLLGCVRCG